MILGPDGNVWFSRRKVSQIGRITPQGKITEFRDGITPGCKPLSIAVRDGALWFSEAAGNASDASEWTALVTEFPIPSHDSQPRAMVTHPDGSIWFVETSTNALGRIDRNGAIREFVIPTPNATLRGSLARRRSWFTSVHDRPAMAPDHADRRNTIPRRSAADCASRWPPSIQNTGDGGIIG